jgi:serine phosphatase RsbU (regulator of sigma subunit)
VLLLSQTLPTPDQGYAAFNEFRRRCPDVPVVLGCRSEEMMALPRFLKLGLRSYVIRDERGDFVFLLLSNLESTVAAVQAERESKLAERLREEMDGVRKLQETIIPRGMRSLKSYRAVARYEPSEVNVVANRPVVMAGGDYYDIFSIGDHTMVLLVGDASGHGLKACMSIITMHTLIRMVQTERYVDTAGFVGDINRWLCENALVQSGGGFITLFYGALDTDRNTLSWTSAGHPLGILYDRPRAEAKLIGGSRDCGMPLGITAEADYETRSVELPPDSRLVVYSDGLTDALAPDSATSGPGKRSFGVQGIIEAMQAGSQDTLETALDRLFKRSRAFTGGEGRHDDTSVVMVERFEP